MFKKLEKAEQRGKQKEGSKKEYWLLQREREHHLLLQSRFYGAFLNLLSLAIFFIGKSSTMHSID